MVTTHVLALPNFDEVFVVKMDAFGFSLGVVLMHQDKSITYFSCGLTAREQLKPVYKRELIAIVFDIHTWKHCLLDGKFVVNTDQKSLKFLLEKK